MAKTLKALKGENEMKAKPYPNALTKVRVVKVGHTASFTGSGGDQAQILNFSVADSEEAAMATLNDTTKFSLIKEGKSLIFRNFMSKNGRIILTKHTKIMAGPHITISEEMRIKATTLICPPSPSKTLAEVKTMPRRSLVTVTGQIIKDECMKEVKIGSDPANIHTVRLSQGGDEVDVSLWRDAAEVPVKVGDFIEVTQCVTAEWNRAVVLNTTRNTDVKVVEAPKEQLEGQIEGLSLVNSIVELVVSTGDEFKDLTVPRMMLLEALGLDSCSHDVEDSIVDMLPLSAKFTIKCSVIIEIQINNGTKEEEERGE